MARIVILIGTHLCTAPRPQKEAAALAAAGHEVIVAGGWFDSERAQWDQAIAADAPYRFMRFADIRPEAAFGAARRWMGGARRRLARRRFARTGRSSPALFGLFGAETLAFAAKQTADLFIAHSESALFATSQLPNRVRVGVDFEDWFSEDLLPADRRGRPIADLQRMEARMLRTARYAVTTSHVLARALGRAADADEPAVVYNTFPPSALDGLRNDRVGPDVPSLHWFSQTVGPGRGLEILFEALPQITAPCEIHLRGQIGAHGDWLEARIPAEWRTRIHIHPLVSNAELPSRIAEHDIGLALEDNACPSRDLTITNKFFQYLQAGLAIVATNTRGQIEAAARVPDVVSLVPQRDAPALALALNHLLADPVRLRAAQQTARTGHATHFSWSDQAHTLCERAAAALRPETTGEQRAPAAPIGPA